MVAGLFAIPICIDVQQASFFKFGACILLAGLRLLSGIIQRTTQLVNRVPFDVTTVYHIQNQKEVPETNWIV